MPEVLRSKIRKAKRDHTCSYCGGVIHKGELYDWSQLKNDGDLYEWKAHMDCEMVSREIWDFIDPWDGMTEEDFQEGVQEVCRTFICPDCPKNPDNDPNAEYDDCGEFYCLDKVVNLLKENELEEVSEKGKPWRRWKLSPRKKEENG